jgi:hypothetical protein
MGDAKAFGIGAGVVGCGACVSQRGGNAMRVCALVAFEFSFEESGVGVGFAGGFALKRKPKPKATAFQIRGTTNPVRAEVAFPTVLRYRRKPRDNTPTSNQRLRLVFVDAPQSLRPIPTPFGLMYRSLSTDAASIQQNRCEKRRAQSAEST